MSSRMTSATEAAAVTVERVSSWLGWEAADAARLTALGGAGLSLREARIPEGDELETLLRRLVVPKQAIPEIADGADALRRHGEAWWLLERLHAQLVRGGDGAIAPPWPAPEPGDDPMTRYFHLYVFLAGVPAVLELNGRRGIPEEVTWSTLGDVGLQIANYETRHGRPGFDGAFWVWQHFRGAIFRLGRLQYGFSGADLDGCPMPRSVRTLGVHIPALGPLTPQRCDDSLTLARAFFLRHFPERPCRLATCASWLLDDQLTEYLPASSNIVRFQERFTLVPGWTKPGDDDTVRFVFGYVPASLDELPQKTTLERAVVAHMRRGRSWRIRLGWLEL